MPDPTTGASYPPARHRAAIVQHGSVHEECVPALAHLLRLHAVEPTVYLAAAIEKDRPGFTEQFPALRENTKYVRLGAPDGRAEFWEEVHGTADLLVMNTFRTDADVEFSAPWDGPMLGTVHNARRLDRSETARRMVSSGRVGLLTLAPHVTAKLMSSDPVLYADVATITSAFPAPPVVEPRPATRRSVALPGSVNFESRNYLQLLESLPGIVAKVGESFQITVVGGSFRREGVDRRSRLEVEVEERGLAHLFEFAEVNVHGFVSGNDYYAYQLAADFLLPPIPGDDPSFRSWKITSGIPSSIGLGVPAIIDRWTAAVYGLPSVVHRVGDVTGGLLRALEMTDAEVGELREALARHREQVFARSTAEMGWALAALGLE